MLVWINYHIEVSSFELFVRPQDVASLLGSAGNSLPEVGEGVLIIPGQGGIHEAGTLVDHRSRGDDRGGRVLDACTVRSRGQA